MTKTAASKPVLKLDTNTMPWEERPNAKLGRAMYRKLLVDDPETGVSVRVNRYPAGFVVPWHVHPCAHGIYVLSGTLLTHEGRFGPGSFLWFPEGAPMEHGATAEEDAVVLFVTNKRFALEYVERE